MSEQKDSNQCIAIVDRIDLLGSNGPTPWFLNGDAKAADRSLSSSSFTDTLARRSLIPMTGNRYKLNRCRSNPSLALIRTSCSRKAKAPGSPTSGMWQCAS